MLGHLHMPSSRKSSLHSTGHSITPADEAWKKPQGAKRHGLLVVHGMGEQPKGETLHSFLNGFYNYLHTKVGCEIGPRGHGQIDLDTDLASGQARVVFRDADATDEFLIREVWWAKTIPPLDFWRVLQWLIRHLRAFLRIGFHRFRGRPWELPFLLCVPVLLLVLLALFAAIQVLQWWPFLRGPLNSLTRHLQKAGSTFLVGSVGDVATYTMDLVYANEIRQVLEREIDWMARQEQEVDDIHLLGHSLGSLIAYEVLAQTYRREVDQGALKTRIRTFFSVGSPLDKASEFLAPEHKYRFAGDFPNITWINIYTAYDLVSDRLCRYAERPQNVLVTNKEFPPLALARDHSSYWRNFEVIELVLRTVASSPMLKTCVKHPKGLRWEIERFRKALRREKEQRPQVSAPPPS